MTKAKELSPILDLRVSKHERMLQTSNQKKSSGQFNVSIYKNVNIGKHMEMPNKDTVFFLNKVACPSSGHF